MINISLLNRQEMKKGLIVLQTSQHTNCDNLPKSEGRTGEGPVPVSHSLFS